MMNRIKCRFCGRYYLPYQEGEHYQEETETHRKIKKLNKMTTKDMMKKINKGEL